MAMHMETQRLVLGCKDELDEMRESQKVKTFANSGYALRTAVRLAAKSCSLRMPISTQLQAGTKGTKYVDLCVRMIPPKHHAELRSLDDVGRSWLGWHSPWLIS